MFRHRIVSERIALLFAPEDVLVKCVIGHIDTIHVAYFCSTRIAVYLAVFIDERIQYIESTDDLIGRFQGLSQEFQMLEYMMRNPHMLISTEKFMEKIWGFDSDTEISVVWVYISYLRKKLNTVGSKVTIRAARGAGYSLEYDDA